MRNVHFNFVQRLKLAGPSSGFGSILGIQEGPLGKTAPFARVLDKIRFTGEDSAKIKVTRIDETRANFEGPPEPGFGELDVELDTNDCNEVAKLLETGGWPGANTMDHAWADPLVLALKGELSPTSPQIERPVDRQHKEDQRRCRYPAAPGGGLCHTVDDRAVLPAGDRPPRSHAAGRR